MTSRRRFLQQGTGSLVAATLPVSLAGSGASASASRSFVDLLRGPDAVSVRTPAGDQQLQRAGDGRWSGNGVSVRVVNTAGALRVELSAPATSVSRIGFRWRQADSSTRLILGDAWERGYGDLEWRGFVPDRVMPWYVMMWDGQRADGYGVRTSASALCYWQADPAGLSLYADVRSGGTPVKLGERTLHVCDIVCRAGVQGQSAFQAVRAFCRQMCPNPRMPKQPVYGSNDWYWAYGKNSAESVMADAERVAELSPSGSNRPFVVIDDGWQPGRGASKVGAGTWDRGNDKFPDMTALVGKVRGTGGRPGIWIRPLEAAADVADSWRLPRDRNVLDPTVAAVREKIAADISRLHGWGMELIKHDYSTWDIFGRWGNTMGSALTRDGWTFAEGPKRTTAEVINELYATIRAAAGDSLVIGCNTVSHLSAGAFEICRIGDDTSGREWSRTRKMGVNTLAFRGAQHGAFYAADPDCIGVTTDIPWRLNRQWLDLLARSGTMLWTSLAPDALGAEQKRDLKAAFVLAARVQELAQPGDWMRTTVPAQWSFPNNFEQGYNWGIGEDS